MSSAPDHVLTKEEKDGWTSDKTSRRAYVAENYRVLLLLGDDLNDFVPARGSVEFGRAAIEPHANRIGADWVLIPNPLSGSWERALYSFGEDCAMIDE